MSRLPRPGSHGLRCLRPGGNPLVRTSDRLEVISGLASLVALLLAVLWRRAVGRGPLETVVALAVTPLRRRGP